MSNDPGDLTMMPEVDARALLARQRVHFSVLSPLGSWAGCGTLRVLRARAIEGAVELTCGYESYARVDV